MDSQCGLHDELLERILPVSAGVRKSSDMGSDEDTRTSFRCGFGLGPMLPLTAVGMLGLVVIRRR
jgi:hypothetical protein